MRQRLTKSPGKRLHKIGVLFAGFWLTCNSISFLWKEINMKSDESQDEIIQRILLNKKE
tara:strand:- start:6920 stop:7096 length:177 start_codon:yes stop_codon:yes gene_type:complete